MYVSEIVYNGCLGQGELAVLRHTSRARGLRASAPRHRRYQSGYGQVNGHGAGQGDGAEEGPDR